MKFQGFDVFPVGGANLHMHGDELVVSNIGCSGLDGVLIKYDCLDVDDINHLEEETRTIEFGEIPSLVNDHGVLKTATLRKDTLGRVVTSFESFKWYDEITGNIMVGYNTALLPEKFTFFGTLNGTTKFEIDSEQLVVPVLFDNPDPIDPDDPEVPDPDPPAYIAIPWGVIGNRKHDG